MSLRKKRAARLFDEMLDTAKVEAPAPPTKANVKHPDNSSDFDPGLKHSVPLRCTVVPPPSERNAVRCYLGGEARSPDDTNDSQTTPSRHRASTTVPTCESAAKVESNVATSSQSLLIHARAIAVADMQEPVVPLHPKNTALPNKGGSSLIRRY